MANPFTLAPSLSRPSNSIPREWDPILSASPPSTDTPHPQNSRLKDLARLYNAAVDDFTRVCARHARAVEARNRLNEDGVPTEVTDALKDLPPLDGDEETNEDVLAAKRAFDQTLHAARTAASTLIRARADARVRRGGAALEGDIDALVGGFKERARGAATGKREEEGKFEEWVGLAAQVLRRRMENVRAEAVN